VADFQREAALVERLLTRLKLEGASISDPNADGPETGLDALFRLPDGRVFGVQVTEIDPHTQAGKARAEEKKSAGTNGSNVYSGWAQNSRQVVLDALVRAIERKIKIAARHSFEDACETWLLVCGGIPENGSVISTFVMTPWFSEADADRAVGASLQGSRYDRCFFLPITGAEQAFYSWEKGSSWKKSVRLDELFQTPRTAYESSLLRAATDSDWNKVDQLCDQECERALSEIRKV
jgi:hypothetical protein